MDFSLFNHEVGEKMKTIIFISLILFNPILHANDLQYSITLLPSAPLTIESAVVNDINDSGQIVGSFRREGQAFHAFISSELNGNRVMTDLGSISGNGGARAFGINNLGQVVGESSTEASTAANTSHAFIANKTDKGWVMSDLAPDAFWSSASNINDRSEIVGMIKQMRENQSRHVFVGTKNENNWDITDLAITSQFLSTHFSIDNDSRIVGSLVGRRGRLDTSFIVPKENDEWNVYTLDQFSSEPLIFYGLNNVT
jgi:probable HAF family extracellular repeat protein